MYRILLFLLVFTPFPSLSGQDIPSLFDSLYMSGEVRLTIICPLDSLYRTQREDIEATITIETSEGVLMDNADLLLNLRGKFRRMKCEMPPLMLNFKKSMLRRMGMTTVDDIKLVTHCTDGAEGQENLQEELLCYQLYAALTPYSYRTIWLTVTYQDLYQPERKITSAGFLIEPDKDIRARMGLKEEKIFNLSPDSLDFDSYSRTVVFNFLIGNQDWSIVASRNVKLFYDTTMHKYIVIPYDFDYANIVGASYRRESNPSMTSHPFDRVYHGEYFKEQAGAIAQTFTAHEDTLVNLVHSANNPLAKSRRKKIAKYFSEWFSHIRKVDPAEIQFGMVCPYKGSL